MSSDTAVAADGLVVQNIVAIFHASFHPTKGNTIDWSLSSPSSSPLNLSGVEFSVLPSGLHLVPSDTIYFSHGSHAGLAVFRRRPTSAKAHRGFRLSSLGVLLEKSERARPWVHLGALRELADGIYERAERRERERGEDLLGLGEGPEDAGELTDADFEPAKRWFEARQASASASRPIDVWSGWSDELDGNFASPNTPTHHLPHLLRILGLSSLTLYKFVLARRRILIYTLPPVEVAGVLAWIAADLCREHHMAPRHDVLGQPIHSLFHDARDPNKDNKSDAEASEEEGQEKPESPTVLGMVTLNDLARLEHESATGRGWIACTTDAIFMERPQYYDLIIDLTTSTPSRASRPALYMSKPISPSTNGKRQKWKLESVRFTWSDVKLWTELDRILKLDSSSSSSHHTHTHTSSSPCCLPLPKSVVGPQAGAGAWADVFRLYEDVCLLCATLWMGLGTWRSNSRESFASSSSSSPPSHSSSSSSSSRGADRTGTGTQWGAVRNPGDADWSLEGTHMRVLGMGIEGGPSGKRRDRDKDKGKDKAQIRSVGLGIEGRPLRSHSHSQYSHHARKASSSSSTMKAVPSTSTHVECVNPSDPAFGEREAQQSEVQMTPEEEEDLRRQRMQTTLALLQTFHANTVFWVSRLHEVIPPPSLFSSPAGTPVSANLRGGMVLTGDDYADVGGNAEDREEGDGEGGETGTITITARDMLSLELGVLSELDARFVEWLAEAEGYGFAPPSSASFSQPQPLSTTPATDFSSGSMNGRQYRRRRGMKMKMKRRVVVKRGWQELVGILFGLR